MANYFFATPQRSRDAKKKYRRIFYYMESPIDILQMKGFPK